MTRISGLGGGAPGMTGLNNSGQIAQSPAPSSAAQGNAAINKPDKNGYTPLLRQLTQQDVSAANVDALLKQGASVSATVFAPDDEQLGENPKSPCHYQFSPGSELAIRSGTSVADANGRSRWMAGSGAGHDEEERHLSTRHGRA